MFKLAIVALVAACSHVSVRMAGAGEFPPSDSDFIDRGRCNDFGELAADLEAPVADYLRAHVAHITRIVGAPREEQTGMEIETDDGTLKATRRYCVHVDRRDGHANVTLDLVGYTTG